MVVNVLYYLKFSHLNLWSIEFECYIVNGKSGDCKCLYPFLCGEDASLDFSGFFGTLFVGETWVFCLICAVGVENV